MFFRKKLHQEINQLQQQLVEHRQQAIADQQRQQQEWFCTNTSLMNKSNSVYSNSNYVAAC